MEGSNVYGGTALWLDLYGRKDFDKTAAYLEQEEGYSPHTYRCTGGALTIGNLATT